jgi:hypothetical protein
MITDTLNYELEQRRKQSDGTGRGEAKVMIKLCTQKLVKAVCVGQNTK